MPTVSIDKIQPHRHTRIKKRKGLTSSRVLSIIIVFDPLLCIQSVGLPPELQGVYLYHAVS